MPACCACVPKHLCLQLAIWAATSIISDVDVLPCSFTCPSHSAPLMSSCTWLRKSSPGAGPCLAGAPAAETSRCALLCCRKGFGRRRAHSCRQTQAIIMRATHGPDPVLPTWHRPRTLFKSPNRPLLGHVMHQMQLRSSGVNRASEGICTYVCIFH